MSNLVQCGCCKGRKTITGLGNMTVDCVGCKGVGFVEQLVLAPIIEPMVMAEVVDAKVEGHEVFKSEIAMKLAKRSSIIKKKKVA